MTSQEKQKLAEKIALLLTENEQGSDDSKFFRESLEKINRRLENIEAQINPQIQNSKFKTQNSFAHPSQERFLNIAQIADDIIENLQNEKACPYEPAGKPCDNCSMCNSRGF